MMKNLKTIWEGIIGLAMLLNLAVAIISLVLGFWPLSIFCFIMTGLLGKQISKE